MKRSEAKPRASPKSRARASPALELGVQSPALHVQATGERPSGRGCSRMWSARCFRILPREVSISIQVNQICKDLLHHALVVASNGRQQCSDVPVAEAVLRNPRPTLIGWGQRHSMELGIGIGDLYRGTFLNWSKQIEVWRLPDQCRAAVRCHRSTQLHIFFA